MKKMLNAVILGCGMRGRSVISLFLRELGEKFRICSLYDPNPESVKLAAEAWNMPELSSRKSLKEAVQDPKADYVFIFSPNGCHAAAILAALEAGKKVFSEKPLATTLKDCEAIIAAEKKYKNPIMTGFVLRYSPLYRKVKELLDTGSFGKILNICANENREPHGGGHSMCADYGWRRFRKMAGPYLLEKCSHDLDLFNWFIGEAPSRAASFCGLNYFTPENAGLWKKYDHKLFASLVIPGHCINPFLSEKDIYDNHSVILDYPGGAKVSFQLTLANAIPERRMYVSCTEGTIIAECFSGVIRYRHYGDDYTTELHFTGGGHGGGDSVMVHKLAEAMLKGRTLKVSGSANGLTCARAAIAADESARTGKIVSL